MTIADAKCPRCWYALEGSIRNQMDDSWRLSIVCTECGLDLATRDCIPGYIPTPEWVFDVPKGTRLLQRWLATTGRVLIPFRPWRTLTIFSEMSVLRLLIWWASIYVLVLLTGTALAGWATHLEPYNVFANVSVLSFIGYQDAVRFNWPLTTWDLWRSSVIWGVTGSLMLLPFWFALSGMLWLLPITRRRCKIRVVHILRLAVYSAVPMLLFVLIYPLQSMLAPYFISANYLSGIWLIIFAFIYMPLWWYGAIKYYLKMPHAALVVFMMTVLAATLEALFVFGIQFGVG